MNDSAEGREGFRSGFISFVGRPNVGKSSLTNALVQQKIAITSAKPQTTRRAIRAIVNTSAAQLVLVDTPGVHRPRTLLGERLNALVEDTLSGVDVIGYCVPANEPIGPGDRFINEQLDDYPHAKKVAIITKIDQVGHDKIIEQLALVEQLRDWHALVPVSRTSEPQLAELLEVLTGLLPVAPPLYPQDTVTEETPHDMYAELIREAALSGAREELPHSLAVTIDEETIDDEGVTEIFANLIVERDSQKGLVIGHKGTNLAKIRRSAARSISNMLGKKVKLNLHVKVLKDWQKNPKELRKLGF